MIKRNTEHPPPLQLFRNQADKTELSAEQEEIISLKKDKNAISLPQLPNRSDPAGS